jgi:Rrf2 family protein
MAMINRKTRYALLVAELLADQPDGTLPASEIIRITGLPGRFVETILTEMANAKLIESARGAGGGYKIVQPVCWEKVVRFAQGGCVWADCAESDSGAPCEGCTDRKTCRMRPVWKDLQDAQQKILESQIIVPKLLKKK